MSEPSSSRVQQLLEKNVFNKYPNLANMPAKLMLSDAMKVLCATLPETKDDNSIGKRLTALCQAADSSPWFFLPTGNEDGLVAFQSLFNRFVLYEAPEIQSWLGELKPSEAANTWFDGSLIIHHFDPTSALSRNVVASFLDDKKASLAVLNLGLVLLKTAKQLSSLEQSNQMNPIQACKTIIESIKNDSKLLNKVSEQFASIVPRTNNKNGWSKNPSFNPVVVSNKERARELIKSVDWIGFDMDFTLLEFNERKRLEHIWSCVGYALQAMENELSKEGILGQILLDADSIKLPSAGLIVKSCAIDVAPGNIVKFDSTGRVRRALHGTDIVEDLSDYKDVRYVAGFLDGTSSEKNDAFVFVHTEFELPLALAFAACVDCLDTDGTSELYVKLFDYLKKAFVLAQSPFFEHSLHKGYEDEKFASKLIKKQPDVRKWLEKLRSTCKKRIFLLSDARFDYVQLLLSKVFGEDWVDLFDLVVSDAKKGNGYFHSVSSVSVSAEVTTTTSSPQSPKGTTTTTTRRASYEKKVCMGGNLELLAGFIGSSKVLYFGDHIVKDVALPSSKAGWKTVAVVNGLDSDPGITPEIGGVDASPKLRNSSLSKFLVWSSSFSSTGSNSGGGPGLGSSLLCEQDLSPTLLAHLLNTHATFAVPSIAHCARYNLFVD